MKTSKVRIIRADAERGWRGNPILRPFGIDGPEPVAVANKGQDSADVAAVAYGWPSAYGTAAALIADSGIDLVTVATRCPCATS